MIYMVKWDLAIMRYINMKKIIVFLTALQEWKTRDRSVQKEL